MVETANNLILVPERIMVLPMKTELLPALQSRLEYSSPNSMLIEVQNNVTTALAARLGQQFILH